jgi:hypothetical protein
MHHFDAEVEVLAPISKKKLEPAIYNVDTEEQMLCILATYKTPTRSHESFG